MAESDDFKITLWTVDVAGHRVGAADVVVMLGGTPIDAVAVSYDGERRIATEDGCIEWLVARGVTAEEAKRVIHSARNRSRYGTT